MAATNPSIVVFDQRSVSAGGSVGAGDIAFRPATTSTFLGPPTVLPAIVNSPADESQPALTADGRYLAFVRHGADGHDRLFIWDSQTQTLLNGKGVDLGAMTSHDVGSVSLYSKLILVGAEHQPERVDQPAADGALGHRDHRPAHPRHAPCPGPAGLQARPGHARSARHVQEGPPRHPLGPEGQRPQAAPPAATWSRYGPSPRRSSCASSAARASSACARRRSIGAAGAALPRCAADQGWSICGDRGAVLGACALLARSPSRPRRRHAEGQRRRRRARADRRHRQRRRRHAVHQQDAGSSSRWPTRPTRWTPSARS